MHRRILTGAKLTGLRCWEENFDPISLGRLVPYAQVNQDQHDYDGYYGGVGHHGCDR